MSEPIYSRDLAIMLYALANFYESEVARRDAMKLERRSGEISQQDVVETRELASRLWNMKMEIKP